MMRVAEDLIDRLWSACERIEIAGSLRRRVEFVGDVELLAIPKQPLDLWGERPADAPTVLDDRLRAILAAGSMFKERKLNGPKWKQFVVAHDALAADCQLDLFLTTPEKWGVAFAIRTGPKDFSQSIVTPRARGGLLQNGYRVDDCRLWIDRHDVAAVETPEERDFFEFVQGGFIEPHLRT